jgi:hypothetical protein
MRLRWRTYTSYDNSFNFLPKVILASIILNRNQMGQRIFRAGRDVSDPC